MILDVLNLLALIEWNRAGRCCLAQGAEPVSPLESGAGRAAIGRNGGL